MVQQKAAFFRTLTSVLKLMKSSIEIREIEESDANQIVSLSNELGFSTHLDTVSNQIKTVLSRKDHFAFVAVNNETVIGFIHGFLSIRLTSENTLEIGGLIVSQDYRRLGVGKSLVRHLEQQLESTHKVRVRCNIHRLEAHTFYSTLGYSETKQQKIFDRNND